MASQHRNFCLDWFEYFLFLVISSILELLLDRQRGVLVLTLHHLATWYAILYHLSPVSAPSYPQIKGKSELRYTDAGNSVKVYCPCLRDSLSEFARWSVRCRLVGSVPAGWESRIWFWRLRTLVPYSGLLQAGLPLSDGLQLQGFGYDRLRCRNTVTEFCLESFPCEGWDAMMSSSSSAINEVTYRPAANQSYLSPTTPTTYHSFTYLLISWYIKKHSLQLYNTIQFEIIICYSSPGWRL